MNHLLIAPILLPLVTACLLLLVGDRKHRSQAALGGLALLANLGVAVLLLAQALGGGAGRVLQGQPQVLAATRDGAHGQSEQADRVPTQGPAQGFAQVDVLYTGTTQGLVDAAPGDLDFREFGHRTIM